MRDLAHRLVTLDSTTPLIVIGDRGGPASYELDGAAFYSLEDQLKLPLRIVEHLPTCHYARKNLGYILAIKRRAACVYETDDDNAPMQTWKPRTLEVRARLIQPPSSRQADLWVNVYRFFSDENVWPRGLPLRAIANEAIPLTTAEAADVVSAPIQQGLANNCPDVDAIWRLTMDRPLSFRPDRSVALTSGQWCPFNSQTTWWWPAAYPLMYLPSYCSFRMTDIWRSFIAQRCLWELGAGVVFHAPEVRQERNFHDLMRDFADEVPGYLGNEALCDRLASLELESGPDAVAVNLVRCYDELVGTDFFPSAELALVRDWVADVADARA